MPLYSRKKNEKKYSRLQKLRCVDAVVSIIGVIDDALFVDID